MPQDESSIMNWESDLSRFRLRTSTSSPESITRRRVTRNGVSMKVSGANSSLKNWGLTTSCTVDYILFIKADVDLVPNENEVRDTKYVTANELKTMFNDPTLKFTPWFKLICNSLLFEWWEHLDSGLEKYENEPEIRRM